MKYLYIVLSIKGSNVKDTLSLSLGPDSDLNLTRDLAIEIYAETKNKDKSLVQFFGMWSG